jgi:hypothetical protein
MNLIDQSNGTIARQPTLTQIYRHGELTVRVKVVRDSYEFQSFATAWVLNGNREWTAIAETPASEWHAKTPVEQVAKALAARAAKILG